MVISEMQRTKLHALGRDEKLVREVVVVLFDNIQVSCFVHVHQVKRSLKLEFIGHEAEKGRAQVVGQRSRYNTSAASVRRGN